jgi:hypothetical protein
VRDTILSITSCEQHTYKIKRRMSREETGEKRGRRSERRDKREKLKDGLPHRELVCGGEVRDQQEAVDRHPKHTATCPTILTTIVPEPLLDARDGPAGVQEGQGSHERTPTSQEQLFVHRTPQLLLSEIASSGLLGPMRAQEVRP